MANVMKISTSANGNKASKKSSGTFKAMDPRKCEDEGNSGIKHEAVTSENAANNRNN
jgi:hypothetical protein